MSLRVATSRTGALVAVLGMLGVFGCRGEGRTWSMAWSERREERSKDSATRVETFVLEGRELSAELTTRGAHAEAPKKRARTLAQGEVAALERSIEARGLVRSAEVSLAPAAAPGTDVELALTVTIDGTTTRLRVKGAAGERDERGHDQDGDGHDHDTPESGPPTMANDPLARQLRGLGTELRAMLP